MMKVVCGELGGIEGKRDREKREARREGMGEDEENKRAASRGRKVGEDSPAL